MPSGPNPADKSNRIMSTRRKTVEQLRSVRIPTSIRALVAALAFILGSCALPPRAPHIRATTPDAATLAQLWKDPVDISSRDLFYGPGGSALVPDTTIPYRLLAADSSGYSKGYDVRGPDGLEWSVKLGKEAQAEVVSSRLL